ncbi:MAG: family 20 glycosylhydrolase, partial [Planctomycetota bacterium]
MNRPLHRALLFCSLIVLAGIAQAGPPAIVPQPTKIVVGDQDPFLLPPVLHIEKTDAVEWDGHLSLLDQYVSALTSGRVRVQFSDAATANIRVRREKSRAASGAYDLTISKDGILIQTGSLKGLTYATSTLLQLIGESKQGRIPAVSIRDQPRHAYRSFMIDMGRNPHSAALLRETIDMLWYYKVDSLHLHLTDDQRFAFPSTAFPELWDGIISLQEFRQLESYALRRGVTLIPELEVPGHSTLLRSRYPEVFGASPSELASSDSAFAGVTTILDEMLAVFSSPYIHIGGDEAFGVEESLQRGLINKLHAYLKSKRRQTIVWEGPQLGDAEDRVHPDVIHLNWRTINYPADQMLANGHRVVNAAWDPLYIVDHYPRINFTMTSPQHIYETLKIDRFKHVNPGIRTYAEPISVAPSDQLLGFCMPWWEGREKNFLQQCVPRIIPMAEIAWNPGDPIDYPSFAERVTVAERSRRAAFYPVSIESDDLVLAEDSVLHRSADPGADLPRCRLRNHRSRGTIRYTIDGSAPNAESPIYSDEIPLPKSMTVRVALFDGGEQIGHGDRRNFTVITPQPNLALGKPVQSTATSGPPFSPGRLSDGGSGNLDFY